ncbi:hypothetical protein EHS25_006237 [Saitozyma podzolica]|uniref:Major facilitator superfamily (MFS) profile domain-containing protein n=1 Tax=Saitozyma podzolica TaxID=1890683 RepID=A0A427YR88_9TREE|nr:hypothetical protein EHS25_006237 [Saitozyma podzolica]
MPPPAGTSVVHEAVDKVEVADNTHMDMSQVIQAQQAAEAEKAMTLGQAMKHFHKGILWSMLLSFALVMDGYDIVIINSFWGLPAFLNRFGQIDASGERYISADWQAGLNNANNVGNVIGLAINGFCQYRYGSRKTYIGGMLFMIGAIFIVVFAKDMPMLFGGELVCGIAWGIFQTLTTAYAAEICPLAVRAHLTSFVNICWAMGLFIGAGVVRGTINITGDWGWRMPYVVQWVWPVPLIFVALFAPESPWWLVRKGRNEDAKRSIARCATAGYYSDEELNARVALIEHTHALEHAETKEQSILNCFKGSNLRRTEIVCVVWAIQYWCGQPMTGYAAEFASFGLNLGNYAMLLAGTILVWFFMGKLGRRTIYLAGQALMAVELGTMGILGFFATNSNVSYGIGALMLIFNFTFACTVGPTCYTIVGELPASEVRVQTVVLARMTYIVSGIINSQLTPRMISNTEWGWGARCGLFFLGTNLISFIYCYFRLPETKGRTFGELDILFRNRVAARKFAETKVVEFETDIETPKSKVEEKSAELQVESV